MKNNINMGFKRTGFILILLFLFSFFGSGQDTVRFDDLGFSFQIPEGWQGEEREKNYLMTHPDYSGFIILSTLPNTDRESFKSDLAYGIREGEAFFLSPRDTIEEKEEFIACGLTGLINHSPVNAHGFFCFGEQLIVMILAADFREAYIDIYPIEGRKVAHSVQFYTPKPPTIADTYRTLLTHRRLMQDVQENQLFSENDFSRLTIDLCHEGVFKFMESGIQPEGGGYANRNFMQEGYWTLQNDEAGNTVLFLDFGDDESRSFIISYLDYQLTLDGIPFLILGDSNPDLAPKCD